MQSRAVDLIRVTTEAYCSTHTVLIHLPRHCTYLQLICNNHHSAHTAACSNSTQLLIKTYAVNQHIANAATNLDIDILSTTGTNNNNPTATATATNLWCAPSELELQLLVFQLPSTDCDTFSSERVSSSSTALLSAAAVMSIGISRADVAAAAAACATISCYQYEA